MEAFQVQITFECFCMFSRNDLLNFLQMWQNTSCVFGAPEDPGTVMKDDKNITRL